MKAGRESMSGLRYAEVSQKEQKFLDLTSLTVEEFDQLVPAFEEAFQERMKEWCLDGKKRCGRGYRTYANCPLPTAEERLLAHLGRRENECVASGAGGVVRDAPKESQSMDPDVTARLANDPEKAWGCTCPLDGAIGPAIGTERCANLATGSRSRQPRPSPPFCHDGTQRR